MKQRILTAIIGIIIVAPIILYGSWPFIILAYLLATIALYEMMRMYKSTVNHRFFYFALAIIFLWLLLLPMEEISIFNYSLNKFNLFILFAIILLIAMVISKNNFTYDHASFVLFATLYVGFSFYFVIETRMMGLNVFLFILITIWATDSGAYFIGKFFGKRKLWPEISPNKTIAGAFGGIFFAIIVALLFQFIYPIEFSFFAVLMIAVVISIVGQVGDLVASAMKRHYQIKDFGNIFPGHGGILDRLDSFLFVILFLHVLQIF